MHATIAGDGASQENCTSSIAYWADAFTDCDCVDFGGLQGNKRVENRVQVAGWEPIHKNLGTTYALVIGQHEIVTLQFC